MSRLHIDEDVCAEVQREMVRVDHIRVAIDMKHACNLFPEFWMRRAILRARHALIQRNMVEAQRMLNVLTQIRTDTDHGD